MISSDYVNWVRSAEMRLLQPFLPASGRILEIGAGSGAQSRVLAERGLDVEAIDLATSAYAGARVFPVKDYDGRRIPFPDVDFDAVFSSNTLEHVPDLTGMHAEIRRVLKPGGLAVHVLPTHWWRFWTTLVSLPQAVRRLAQAGSGTPFSRALRNSAEAIAPVRHGERGNFLSELWYFHPSWWRRNFREHGFEIVTDRPLGLFYTGHGFRGEAMALGRRAKLARQLGSATHVFQLRSR